MIHYLVTDRYSSMIRHLLRGLPELRAILCYITYEELFLQLSGPIGHYIFADLDRLSRCEREAAGMFANALRQVAPAARLLNDPVSTLDRLPLLTALHRAGINDFTAVRLDTGERPARFPVFIRTEDGHFGPETDLLADETAFDAALDDLQVRGRPLGGRIAVGFAGGPHPDGRFRRYGAFKIGDRIFAEELFVSERWAVKDAVAHWDPATIAEELDFVRSNPHEEVLRRAFTLAHVDFGRMDYGVVDGRVQVYEINTNPTFSVGPRDDARNERRALARRSTIEAFRALDTPLVEKGRVSFARLVESAEQVSGLTVLSQPFEQAVAAYNAGRFFEAEQLCQQLVARGTDSFDTLLLLGAAQTNLGRKHAALASYENAIKLRPEVSWAHFRRGQVLHQLERYADAVASYDRAIQLRPDFAMAYSDRGVSLGVLQRHREALASYDRAVEIRPDFAAAHFNRGNVLQELNRFDEALVAYDRALQLNPEHAQANCNRGNVLQKLKR
jgi:Flp pilus assembly protein TadD